jgi:thioredoxin reductase (NADPH)
MTNAKEMPALDCLIIGAGPAGLTAATYLGRFRRSACVVHTGDSRVMQVPKLRNFPGFPEGISGRDLLERMRRQAGLYGASFAQCGIATLEQAPAGGFVARNGSHVFHARTVILATGVADRKPEIPGVAEAIASGTMRLCPVCDGYETAGKSVGVLGSDEHAVREAVFLRRYTGEIALLAHQPQPHLKAAAAQAGLKVLETSGSMAPDESGFSVELADRSDARFDILYPALGCEVRSRLATALGADRDSDGYVRVDPHQETSVEGLFACGDVVHALNQVSVACGQAAIAATAIHNRLGQESPWNRG